MSQAPAESARVDPELVAKLASRMLWMFWVPAGTNAFEAAIPLLEKDSRVKRGEFVVGVHVTAVQEGVVLAGVLETVLTTGPGAFRNLRDLPLPPFELRVSQQGTLRPVERDTAEKLWQYLLLNDPGLHAFVRPVLADEKQDLGALLDLYAERLLGSHRPTSERCSTSTPSGCWDLIAGRSSARSPWPKRTQS